LQDPATSQIYTLSLHDALPISNPKEMGLALDQIQPRTGLATQDVAAALATYVRTIRSHDSRYDWFQAGQREMLTEVERAGLDVRDRKSTRLNSSHVAISYAVFC